MWIRLRSRAREAVTLGALPEGRTDERLMRCDEMWEEAARCCGQLAI